MQPTARASERPTPVGSSKGQTGPTKYVVTPRSLFISLEDARQCSIEETADLLILGILETLPIKIE